MSEPRIPGDPLTRAERAALIQANLQKETTNHRPSCHCGVCGARDDGPPASEETQAQTGHE